MSTSWAPGAHAFFTLRSGSKLEGVLIEEGSDSWIVAVPNGVVEGPPTSIRLGEDSTVQVPYRKSQTRCLRQVLPRHWHAELLTFSGTVPSLRQLVSAYDEQAVASEAEEPRVINQCPEASRAAERSIPNARRMDRLAVLYAQEFPEGRRGAAALDDDTGEEDGLVDPEDFLNLPRSRTAKQVLRDQQPRRRQADEDVPDAEQAQRRRDRRLELLEDKVLADGDYDKLFKLEMIRMVDENRRRRTRGGELDLMLDDDDDTERRGRTSLGKAVARMDKMRRAVPEKPGQIVKGFRSDVMLEINADAHSNWRYRDHTRKISWEQMTTMQRDPLSRKERAGSATELVICADGAAAEGLIVKKSRMTRGDQPQHDEKEKAKGDKTPAKAKAKARAGGGAAAEDER